MKKGDIESDGNLDAYDLTIRKGPRGAVLFRGPGKWRKLPPGVDGQVLTTHGPGADPTWETPSLGATMQTGTYVGTGALLNQDIVVGFTPDFIQVSHAESPASGIVAHRTPEMVTLNGPAQFCIIIDDLAGPGLPGINPVPWLTQPVASQFRVTQDLNILDKVYFWVAFNKQGTA